MNNAQRAFPLILMLALAACVPTERTSGALEAALPMSEAALAAGLLAGPFAGMAVGSWGSSPSVAPQFARVSRERATPPRGRSEPPA